MQNHHIAYLSVTAVLAFGAGALIGNIGPSNNSLNQSDQAVTKRASTRVRQARNERLTVENVRNFPGAGDRGLELSVDLCEIALSNLDLSGDEFPQMAKSLKNADIDKKTIGEYSLYLSWLKQDPRAAMNSSIAQYDDNIMLRSLLFEQWADADPLAAAEKFRENPYVVHIGGSSTYGGSSVKVAKSLAKKLKASNPQAAEEWASTLPTEIRNAALQELADSGN
jgi:hypothetical protein